MSSLSCDVIDVVMSLVYDVVMFAMPSVIYDVIKCSFASSISTSDPF